MYNFQNFLRHLESSTRKEGSKSGEKEEGGKRRKGRKNVTYTSIVNILESYSNSAHYYMYTPGINIYVKLTTSVLLECTNFLCFDSVEDKEKDLSH